MLVGAGIFIVREIVIQAILFLFGFTIIGASFLDAGIRRNRGGGSPSAWLKLQVLLHY